MAKTVLLGLYTLLLWWQSFARLVDSDKSEVAFACLHVNSLDGRHFFRFVPLVLRRSLIQAHGVRRCCNVNVFRYLYFLWHVSVFNVFSREILFTHRKIETRESRVTLASSDESSEYSSCLPQFSRRSFWWRRCSFRWAGLESTQSSRWKAERWVKLNPQTEFPVGAKLSLSGF